MQLHHLPAVPYSIAQSLSPDTSYCAGKAEESIAAEVAELVRKTAFLQLLSSTAPAIRRAGYSCISTVCKR